MVREIQRAIEMEYEGAEGPTSVWICKPSEEPVYESRDLALEAFKNGHPHLIRW